MFYIYTITNKKNNKVYVGSTKNFIHRKTEHLYQLTNRTHSNLQLLKDWIQYGEEAFVFEVILTGENDKYKLITE